jgi:hypothetical protein
MKEFNQIKLDAILMEVKELDKTKDELSREIKALKTKLDQLYGVQEEKMSQYQETCFDMGVVQVDVNTRNGPELSIWQKLLSSNLEREHLFTFSVVGLNDETDDYSVLSQTTVSDYIQPELYQELFDVCDYLTPTPENDKKALRLIIEMGILDGYRYVLLGDKLFDLEDL